MNNLQTKAASVFAAAALFALAGCTGLNISEKGRSFSKGDVAQKVLDAGQAVSSMMQAETKIGREAAASMIARYGLADDEKMQRYVRLIGASVARKATRTDVKWRFAVLDSRDPNAFAAPGGYVFVTRGLIKMLEDEAQLAGVLAHEVGHVDEKHAMKAANIAATASAASKILTDRAEFQLGADKIIKLIDHGYARSDEMAADRAGTLMISKVGYDTTGLIRALERHAEKTGDRSNGFAKRHPPVDARVKSIEGLKLPDKGVSLEKRFKATLGA